MPMSIEERRKMNRVWSKNYRLKHPEKRKESSLAYYYRNIEKIREYSRKRYHKKKEHILEVGKRYAKTPGAKKKARERYLKSRQKVRARNIIGKQLRRGKLKPEPCSICNTIKTEAHHPDYSKPRFVIWLCKTCHCKIHRKH